MKCPTDNVDLAMSERSGVEIDYCPKCRGVWLDRGELDKIIEKSQVSTPQQSSKQPYREPDYPAQGYGKHDADNRQSDKRRKKEGFLGELFDF